ncbi:hypothetical protein MMC20_004927 [Loxospora ochrophaea]|nr:hypothetical protein [Loxospora ochrophaea]
MESLIEKEFDRLQSELSPLSSASAGAGRVEKRPRQFIVRKWDIPSTHKVSAATTTGPPPFFSLPLEIREHIYAYTCISPIGATDVRCNANAIHRKPPAANITLVCRQIHQEACKVLYGANVIFLASPDIAAQFFLTIGSTNVGRLRKLKLHAIFYHAEWAAVLDNVNPGNLFQLEIWGMKYKRMRLELNQVDEQLVAAVRRVFARNQNRSIIPTLTLTWFSTEERPKFPSRWDVRILEREEFCF